MTPERWKQIDELAQAALERGVAERAGFLDEACAGDEVLRREVESQIAYWPGAAKLIRTSSQYGKMRMLICRS
ncbi:MAG: hypothetical protein AABO57_15585 [Acidobacteriota bacterium]